MGEDSGEHQKAPKNEGESAGDPKPDVFTKSEIDTLADILSSENKDLFDDSSQNDLDDTGKFSHGDNE